MKLIVRGKGEFSVNEPRPIVAKMIAGLDKLKDGELITNIDLPSAIGVSNSSFAEVMHFFEGYTFKWRRTRYWGNKRSINQLIKETQNESSRRRKKE